MNDLFCDRCDSIRDPQALPPHDPDGVNHVLAGARSSHAAALDALTDAQAQIGHLEAVYHAAEHFDIAYSTDTEWRAELEALRSAIAAYQHHREATTNV